jgi:SAM-dependent methyltransferase
MDSLAYIGRRFGIDVTIKPPIIIPNINRQIMAQVLHELGYKVGVEIGTQQDIHAETLCKNNPGMHLYCVDPWESYAGYTEHANEMEDFYETSQKRLSIYQCTLLKKMSMDALADFKDKSLDFVYIDGGHDFKNVANDIIEWPRKVRPGGMVFGHDYKRQHNHYQNAVKDVIPAYCYHFRISPWFILGEQGHSDGLYKEGTQSWMFIKT